MSCRQLARMIALLTLLFLACLVGLLFLWRFGLSYLTRPLATVVLAGYRADFQSEKPKAGWRFLWNAYGEIGNARAYGDLVWNGQLFALDTDPKLPRAAPARFLRLSKGGGHPGLGSQQQ